MKVQTSVVMGHKHVWDTDQAFTTRVDGHRHGVTDPSSRRTDTADGHSHALLVGKR